MMNRHGYWDIIVCLITLMLLTASCPREATAPKELVNFTVQRKTLEHFIETNGSIRSRHLVNIQAPISGRLDQLFIKEGQRVKRGQRLALMSSDERARMLDMAIGQGPDEVAFWQQQLLPTLIVAPTHGTVIEIMSRPPDQVRGVFMRISRGEMVVAHVDEVDLPKIKLHQSVKVQLEIDPEQLIPATLESIGQVSKKVSNVNVYEIEVGLNPEQTSETEMSMLRIGMSVIVQIPTHQVNDALYLPIEAVAGKANTEVAMTTQTQQSQQVMLGDIFQDAVHVISGLNEGEIVLVEKFTPTSQGSQRKSPLGFLKK